MSDAGGAVIHREFARVARGRPDAVALVCEGHHVSYAALRRASLRLAHRLLACRVGPEDVVAISASRSVETIAGLLAILEVGGAYLPLDPAYPRGRLQYMLADSGARLVLVGDEQAGIFRQQGVRELPLRAVEEDEACEDAAARRRLANSVTPDRLAYVMYTSGSTGQPKGIMVPHQAVVNHIRWRVGTFGLTCRDRLLQRTPLSFDISVWEVFGALLTGCVLVLPRAAEASESACVIDAVIKTEVTSLEIVPSILKLMVRVPELCACQSLRWLFCGGEPLPGDLASHCQVLLGATIVNVYGPTETTIWSTFWICPPGNVARVPIGRPIWHTTAFLLDDHWRPVPHGERAMLFLGGLGLARGYWRRPDLTAAAFVPHGQTDALPGERLYNTGDLARLGPDEALEFMGRKDGQIKLRGFRIELDEIEHALKACPLVADGLAMLRTSPRGDRKIVCYYVLRSVGNTMAVNAFRHTHYHEIRDFVASRLPDYMVPHHFRNIDEIPLLPNGKVNLKALPEPTYDDLSSAEPDPQTEQERVLAQVWCEVLGLPHVACDLRFSWYGGDSLAMVEVRLLAEQRGLFIPAAAPRNYSTVRQLAAAAVPLTTPTRAWRARGAELATYVRRRARNSVVETRDQIRQWRTRRLEAPDRKRFRQFYERLGNTRDIYYLFVRRGLLHWAAAQMRLVPEDVNLVLIGSAMTPAEQTWVHEHVSRPFFNTDLAIDDNAAWEFLFETNERSFGWLEIGSFVNNSALFGELARIEDKVAFNCTYIHTERHRRLFMEYLLFVNIKAIRALAAHKLEVYPSRYSSRGEPRAEHPAAWHRVPRARDRAVVRRLLRDAMSDRAGGLAGWLASQEVFGLYFYIGHLFYLHVRELGFEIKRVRNLTEPSEGGGFHNFFSDEVITALQVSRYEHAYRTRKFAEDFAMTLQAEYAVLRAAVARLPAAYAARLAELEARMVGLGLNPRDAGRNTIDYLVRLSVSRHVFDAPAWQFLR